MARNNRPFIIGAAALGVLALLATLFTLFAPGGGPPAGPNAAAPGDAPPPAATRKQFVAINTIPPRTRLTRALFREEDVPENEVKSGAITNLDDLNGRISASTISPNQVLTQDTTTQGVRRVVPANIEIPGNSRAVAIYVDPEQTAAGLVDVGDRVDVIATHRFTLAAGANQRIQGAGQISAGRVIGQNLQVLAVDKSLAAPTPVPTPAADQQVPGSGPAPPPPGAAPGAAAPAAAPTPAPPPGTQIRTRVLLAAPLDIAARLVAANEEGKLHVVIRNPSSLDLPLVPEAREYPSRVVDVPVPRNPNRAAAAGAAVGAGAGRAAAGSSPSPDSSEERRSARRRPAADDFDPPAPSIPSPAGRPVAPAPVPSFNDGGSRNGGNNGIGVQAPVAPAPPPENEVTVIRGTEKTRVLVPR
jgi:Flp pilus assembly protein CpaB